MLLAVAWTTDDDVRLMHLFPEVWFMDTTFSTNKEKRPLFKLAGIDSNRQSFTGINIFLPSNRKWVFSWVMIAAIPTLSGKRALQLNNLVVTDNDSQMHSPLTENAFAGGVWAGSTHSLCMFHMVMHNFKVSVKLPSNFPENKKVKAQKILKTVKNWVKSWFTTCETHEEISISKSLLEVWLDLPETELAIYRVTSTAIKVWIDTKIMVYYHKWNRPRNLYLRALDQVSSSIVEHENWSTKGSGDVVRASMNLCTSASVMNNKSIYRNLLKQSAAAEALTKQPMWSNTPSSKHLTAFAEGLLHSEWTARKHQCSARVKPCLFYVRHTVPSVQFVSNRPITLFTRVRTVEVIQHLGMSRLKC